MFLQEQIKGSIIIIIEVLVDIVLGVSIPEHHAGDFAGEQNSLHALALKREISKKGFPYLGRTAAVRSRVNRKLSGRW